MLFADRREQCPLRLGQLATSATVGPRRWPKGLQTARFVGVIPALQRLYRECLGRVGIGRPEALLAQLGEGQRTLGDARQLPLVVTTQLGGARVWRGPSAKVITRQALLPRIPARPTRHPTATGCTEWPPLAPTCAVATHRSATVAPTETSGPHRWRQPISAASSSAPSRSPTPTCTRAAASRPPKGPAARTGR